MKNIFLFLHIIFAGIMLQAQNTNLPVGVIPGAIDVSPMGAATYTIPIDVVPGTQGMQPNLSIVYNSMSGMGLLGMKWNLAGLSAITRCGQTPYYDDNITTIGFSRIANIVELDGERLIKTATISANGVFSEFATERENFTRVYSHGTFAFGSPFLTTHFKAYTDDGSVFEYGNTMDSRHFLGIPEGSILSWKINKITDADGNYMTYHYSKTYQEILIDSIIYTGNGSIQPYAKVEFGYTTLPNNFGKNTFFISGYSLQQTKLLETITVSYNNSMVRKYQFNYNVNDTGERTTHLKEVVLFGEGGAQLNATAIEWGDKNNSKQEDILSLQDDGYIITGDFNGDGYTDYVIYGQTASQNVWKYYENSTTGSFTFKSSGNHKSVATEGDCYFYKADVNGDGSDELIIISKSTNPVDRIVQIFSLKNGVTQIGSNIIINDFNQVLFGDFDGDGQDAGLLDENFVNAMEHYAYTYSDFLGGNYKNHKIDWDRISPENRARINFTNYRWTYLYNKPF